MNKEKLDWSLLVKESSIRKGVFTEKMKQTVINRVEKNEGRKRNRGLYYIVSPLIALLICISIFSFLDRVPLLTSLQQTPDTTGSAGAPLGDIVLKYEPAPELDVIPDTDKGVRGGQTLLRLPLSSVQIQETVPVGGIGTYLEYTKLEDGDTPYFGFELADQNSSTNKAFYEIGYGRLSEVTFQKSDAFGFSDLRLSGRCGPERKCAFWISVDGDTVRAYEQMDAATIYEQDLDGDGITEAIILTNAKDIYIYKKIADRVQSVHVQSALQADHRDTVTYSPDNQVFKLSNQEETHRYRYTEDGDRLRLWVPTF